MEELKNELEKLGRDVAEGPSLGIDDVPQTRRQSTRKAVTGAGSSKAADIDMVAADMTVKQLQAALSSHHVVPPKGAKKAALVKMLDKARMDSAASSGKNHGPSGQKRKPGSSTLAAPTNKRKKPNKGGAKSEAAAEESTTRVDEEQDGADPVLAAGKMAATKAEKLDFSVLMKACEVRGLDSFASRVELCDHLRSVAVLSCRFLVLRAGVTQLRCLRTLCFCCCLFRCESLANHAKQQAADYASKTASALKEECAKLNLQTSGNKSMLVTRLVEQQWRAFSVKAAAQ